MPTSLKKVGEKAGKKYNTVQRWKKAGILIPVIIPGRKFPFYLDREVSQMIKNALIDSDKDKEI